jgi:GNAT superfamily N-acetyltransferase
MNQTVKVREGVKSDLPRVLELIRELALYEKAPHEVINTVEQMESDGFGPNPIYGRYSTWKGKRLYLEDIIVTEDQRGNGIGKLLFERTMRHTVDQNCTGMMWQVLDWNEPAINFYKKYGAKLDGEWMNGTLEKAQILSLLHH